MNRWSDEVAWYLGRNGIIDFWGVFSEHFSLRATEAPIWRHFAPQNAPNSANGHKTLTSARMKMYDTPKKAQSSTFGGVLKDHFYLRAPEVPCWRIFAPNCAKLRPLIKDEPLIAWSCLLLQKKRNHRLLGSVLRTFFSQSSGSANLAPFCSKLRPGIKHEPLIASSVAWYLERNGIIDFWACSQDIFLSMHRKC